MCLFYDRWESHLKIRALPSTVILSLSWRLRWLKLFQDCVATKSKRDITRAKIHILVLRIGILDLST